MEIAHTWGYEPFHPRRRYRPLEDLVDEGVPIVRCLNIGPLEEAVLVAELPCAVVSEETDQLPSDCYWFGNGTALELMVVERGADPGPGFSLASTDAEFDDSFLGPARAWFDYYIPQSTEVPRPAFAPKDEVVAVGSDEVGVVRSRRFNEGWTYDVTIAGRSSRISETSLRPATAAGGPLDWIKQKPAGPKRISATITREKLRLAGTER